MASRKTTTKKAAKAAPKRVRKPAAKAPPPRGAGKTTAQEDFIRKMIAAGRVDAVRVASLEYDPSDIRNGVEPSRTLRYTDIPAERYDEFLANGGRRDAQAAIQKLLESGHIKSVYAGSVRPFTLHEDNPKLADRETGFTTRVTDADGNFCDFNFPSGDDMRRRFEEDCKKQAANRRSMEPRTMGEDIGDHRADALRYGIGAMAQQTKPASGLRVELSRQDANISALHTALDELCAVLDPVLARELDVIPPTGAGVEIDPSTEFEQTARDHSDRISFGTRRIQSLLRRLAL